MDKLGWRKSTKGSSSSNDYSFFFGTGDGKFKRIHGLSTLSGLLGSNNKNSSI